MESTSAFVVVGIGPRVIYFARPLRYHAPGSAVFHDRDDCPESADLPPETVRLGSGGKTLCGVCFIRSVQNAVT